jgi:hypothetical protein
MAAYNEKNRQERLRLIALLESLSDAQLEEKLPNGWRVADALAHLAFWDCYDVALLQEWQRNGFHKPSAEWNPINAAVESMSRTIPFPALRAWVRDSAEQSDHCVEQIAPVLADAIVAVGKEDFLFRSTHRAHHLNQIENLSGPKC